jgi:hypothetical protein
MHVRSRLPYAGTTRIRFQGSSSKGLSAMRLPQLYDKTRYSTERTYVNDIMGLYPFNSFTTVMPSSKWSMMFSAPND